MLNRRHQLLFLLVASCVWAVGFAVDPIEDEIEHLILSVAESGCEFERNGDRYNAHDAADHLRLKYRRGKRYASTAESFIDRLATKSSWTGKHYLMICSNAGEHTANAWLHAALEAYRESHDGR